MIGDLHGQAVGRATLLVRAVDEILGTDKCEASYSWMIVAGIRPRSLAWCPRCLAHALISALRPRLGPVRALRRRWR